MGQMCCGAHIVSTTSPPVEPPSSDFDVSDGLNKVQRFKVQGGQCSDVGRWIWTSRRLFIQMMNVRGGREPVWIIIVNG